MATLLTVPDQKEGLAVVYVKALAVRAGFVAAKPDLDRDSVDLQIMAGGPMRPKLDLQLKATAVLAESEDGVRRIRLSRKNYDDLRVDTQTPRLLVVLELPPEEEKWMTVTTEELVLRRRAFWLSLQVDFEEAGERETVTVSIPERNLLDVDSLRALMERSRKGTI